MNKLQVLLADDHIVMRTGLRALLERQPNLEGVGECENGREAVELAASLRPDVVVMDVGMPVLNGIEATKTIVTQHPTTAVVILSMHADESYVMRALKAGARGYILKDDADRNLTAAVDALRRHKPYLSSRVSGVFSKTMLSPSEDSGSERRRLTPREREIVQLLAEGKSNKEIAGLLGISVKTAETHRANIMLKLDFHSITELVRYAVRNRIIQG